MQGRNTLAVTGNSSSVLSAEVVRVIDGDTIEACCIGGKQEKVRYIGIDSPETNHPTKGVESFGKEAAEANRKLIEGKAARLEFDVRGGKQGLYGNAQEVVGDEENGAGAVRL